MERKLIEFIRVLRNADVRISTSETIDAMHTLALVGYDERATLKQALSASLAKSETEKESFDYCFEHFFNYSSDKSSKDDEALHGERARDGSPEPGSEGEPEEGPAEAQLDPHSLSEGQGQGELATLLLAENPGQLSAEIVRAAKATDLASIRLFTQKGLFSRRILDHLGLSELNDNIHTLEQSDSGADLQLAHTLKRGKKQLNDQVRDYVEQQYLLYAGNNGQRLREEILGQARLANIDLHYRADMQQLMRKLARKLAKRYARRKRVARKGQLDAGKTIRRNIGNDSIPFHTYWKYSRKQRPDVYVLCDVSGSVAMYAEFLLILIYSLHEVLPQVRAFAFSSFLGEVTDTLKNHSIEEAMPIINKQWGMGSTDYGASLQLFADQCLTKLDRHSSVIIIGDGRNNYGDPNIETLRAIYQRAQRVLWLNPESTAMWGSGDSEIPRYKTYCHDVRVCGTLRQLEVGINSLLRVTL